METATIEAGAPGMEARELLRERRLRRAAARQGLRLSKSPRRDPRASDYGRYRISDLDGVVVAGGAPSRFSLDLDGVEEFLFRYRRHGHPLRRDEDYENAITPHAPHDGVWRPDQVHR
jgi:hypothetical protein